MTSVTISILLGRGLAFVLGAFLTIVSLYTYKKQEGIVQKQLKFTWVRLHKTKKRWDRFVYIFYCVLEFIIQKMEHLLTVTLRPNQVAVLILELIILNIGLTAYFTSVFLHNSLLPIISEVIVISALLIILVCIYLLALSRLSKFYRQILLVLVGLIELQLVNPYLHQIIPTYRNIMFIGAAIYVPLLYFSVYLFFKLKIWKKLARLFMVSLILGIYICYMLKRASSGFTHLTTADAGMEMYKFHDTASRLFFIVLSFYPLVCMLTMLLLLVISVVVFISWLSVTATVRSMFEHAVIKRHKLLLMLGVLLICYALPHNSLLRKMKEIVTILLG